MSLRRVLNPHRVLGSDRVLGLYRVLEPNTVLRSQRVLNPHGVMGLLRVLGPHAILGSHRVLRPNRVLGSQESWVLSGSWVPFFRYAVNFNQGKSDIMIMITIKFYRKRITLINPFKTLEGLVDYV